MGIGPCQVERPLGLHNVTVVGHSMGGAVTLRHAARFGRRVGKLVLVEASAPRYVFGPKAAELAAGLAGLIEGYATNRAATIRLPGAVVLRNPHRRRHRPAPAVLRATVLDDASLHASRAGLVALRDTNLAADTKLVTVPTRIFHARQDNIVPFDHGEALAADIAGAQLIAFAHGGHGIYIDETDKLNRELLKFVP